MNYSFFETTNNYPIKVTRCLIQFRDFLNNVWDSLHELHSDQDWKKDPDFIHEWVQANWEFLVERKLFTEYDIEEGRLTPCTLFNSHILRTDSKINISHEIFCKAKPGLPLIDRKTQDMISDESKLIFRTFVKQSPYFELAPPFDGIKVFCVQTKKHHFLPIDHIEFYLAPVSLSTVSALC